MRAADVCFAFVALDVRLLATLLATTPCVAEAQSLCSLLICKHNVLDNLSEQQVATLSLVVIATSTSDYSTCLERENDGTAELSIAYKQISTQRSSLSCKANFHSECLELTQAFGLR